MCEYCNDNGIELINTRQWSKNGNEANTGFEVYVWSGKLKVFACLDKPHIKPICAGTQVDIKYCPMCGRDLYTREERPMTAAENRAYWGTFG